MFTTWFIAYVESLSALVSREQKGKLRGRGKGRRETFPTSVLAIHLLPFTFFSLQLARNNSIVNACDARYPTYEPWFPRCDNSITVPLPFVRGKRQTTSIYGYGF